MEVMEFKTPKFSWSEITCGESCWRAECVECHCSCGGKNHAIWRDNKNAIVQRTKKINGVIYKMIGVGTRNELRTAQGELLKGYGILRCYDYANDGNFTHQTYTHYLWCRSDSELRGFPVVLKNATDSEMAKWHELQAYKKYDGHEYSQTIATLWEVMEKPKECVHTCKDAISIKEK